MAHICSNFCFTSYDIFSTFNLKQLKIKRTVVQDVYGCNKKQMFCASVFTYCCYLILCDIIQNNATFVLPLFNGRGAQINVCPITGETLKKARQNGAFQDIDLLVTNFTGYQLRYTWESYGNYRSKPIYINKRFKDVLIKYINEGKQYY